MAFEQSFNSRGPQNQNDLVKQKSPGTPLVKKDDIKPIGLEKSHTFGRDELSSFLSIAMRSRPTVLGMEYRWGKSKDSVKDTIELPIDVQTRPREAIASALADMISSYGNSFLALKFDVIREGETEASVELLEGGLAEEDLAPQLLLSYRPAS